MPAGAGMIDTFAGLPRNHFGAILADPPWHFEVWSNDCYAAIRERVAVGGPGFDPDRKPPVIA